MSNFGPRAIRLLKRVALLLALGALAAGIDFVVHKPAGAYCKSPSECRSRLCSAAGYCTQRCTKDASCPAGYFCRESTVYLHRPGAADPYTGGTVEKLCLQ